MPGVQSRSCRKQACFCCAACKCLTAATSGTPNSKVALASLANSICATRSAMNLCSNRFRHQLRPQSALRVSPRAAACASGTRVFAVLLSYFVLRCRRLVVSRLCIHIRLRHGGRLSNRFAPTGAVPFAMPSWPFIFSEILRAESANGE